MSERNPYDSMSAQEFITKSILEAPTLAYRIPHILYERHETREVDGEYWLQRTYEQARESGSAIFNPDLLPHLTRRIGHGFSTTAFAFENGEHEWVLKLGLSQSLDIGKINPSHPDYADWYRHNLAVQYEVYEPRLPFLIPTPQEVYYVHDTPATGRTVIIQPYIRDIIPPEQFKDLPEAQVEGLLDEMMTFDLLSRDMLAHRRLNPDIMPGWGNLAVNQAGESAHLVLMDNGLSDRRVPSPMLHMLNYAMYHARFTGEVRALKDTLASIRAQI